MCTPRVRLHVLVVDDYDDGADVLAFLLATDSLMHLTTEVGHDGMEAVTMALGRRPDVAVLDIDMPIMNGIDAAIAIRAGVRPAPLLIAVTGNPWHQAAMQTHQAFDKVLTKPVDIDRLLALFCQA